MNNGFQHKIFNYEAEPPVRVWENIREELDSSLLSSGLPQKLKEAAITPPDYVRNKIFQSLDNLAAEGSVAAKLQAAEVLPPTGIWQKIETALETGEEAAKPIKKIRPFLRYAAAAVVAGILLWSGLSLFNNKSGKEVVTVKTEPPSNPGIEIKAPDKVFPGEDLAQNGVDAALEEARNDAALEASKKTYAKLDATTISKKIRDVSSFNFVSQAADENDPAVTTVVNNNISHRYIVLMTPEGNIIRMSKKLKDLVCCISGEETDAACLDQMKRWREKILSSSTVHAPGSFADILNLVTSLQDSKQ